MEGESNQPKPDMPKQNPVTPPTPIVYESEEYRWEYKYIQQDLDDEELLDESRLNELGKEGWELVGVFNHQETAHYYFKRALNET